MMINQPTPGSASPFQSSPVTKDGRYLRTPMQKLQRHMFQSSPVTKDGRYGGRAPDRRAVAVVSILARH